MAERPGYLMGGLKVQDKTQSLTLIGYKVRSGGDNEWKRYRRKTKKWADKCMLSFLMTSVLSAMQFKVDKNISQQYEVDSLYYSNSLNWARIYV